ncbi:hypothetical protein Tsubulata_003989, partial [Turnera subulata]
PQEEDVSSQQASPLQIPVINLRHLNQLDVAQRKRIIEEMSGAAETWGSSRFHEMPHHERSKYYSRDNKHKIRLTSNNLL